MHQALYRKWRPSTFDEVCGQDHITSVLKYEVEHNKTTHAYLFCGSRGTGKTSCAKILAKALNCLSPEKGNPCGKCEACIAIDENLTTDVLEMDAASNTGVDYIRDIRDAVVYSPAMLKNRVYIIDEVHMLSTAAFNALLKTLEEPPKQVVFILATTEVQKIPVTVLSRCQRFDFHRITIDTIAKRLLFIAENENISLTSDGAKLIAKLAQGGLRDAVSMLELCSGGGREVNSDIVTETAGICGRDSIVRIVQAIINKDYETIFSEVSDIYTSSLDISVFWQDLMLFYRDMMVYKSSKKSIAYIDLLESEIDDVKNCSEAFSFETLLYHSRLLDEAFIEMQRSNAQKRITAEMTLVRMSDSKLNDTNDALLSRISQLEEKLSLLETGVVPKKIPSKAPEDKQNRIEETLSGNKRELTVIGNWIEIIKRFSKDNKVAAAFLQRSTALRAADENKIIIRVSDSLSKMMLEKEDTLSQICDIIKIVNPNDASLKVEIEVVPENNKDKYSELEDIIQNGI